MIGKTNAVAGGGVEVLEIGGAGTLVCTSYSSGSTNPTIAHLSSSPVVSSYIQCPVMPIYGKTIETNFKTTTTSVTTFYSKQTSTTAWKDLLDGWGLNKLPDGTYYANVGVNVYTDKIYQCRAKFTVADGELAISAGNATSYITCGNSNNNRTAYLISVTKDVI